MTAETAVALRPSGRLQIADDQDYWSPEQVAGLKVLGLKGATTGDLAVYFHYCRRTMLDPFSRQIYMINRKTKERFQDDRGQWQEKWVDKQTIQVGIDGFRVVRDRVAERTACEVEFEDTTWFDAAGAEYAVWLREDAPTACRVVLIKHSNATGRALRYPAVLRMASYIQTNNRGEPVSQWKSQPDHMLEKCCEAFATRRAFPNDFSGVYLEEEMQNGDGRLADSPGAVRKVTAGQILREEPPSDEDAGTSPGEPEPGEVADGEVIPGDVPERCSAGQTSVIKAQFGRLGFDLQTDSPQMLAAAAVLAGKSVGIADMGDLTEDEAGRVRDALKALTGRDDLMALLVKLGEQMAEAAQSSPAQTHVVLARAELLRAALDVLCAEHHLSDAGASVARLADAEHSLSLAARDLTNAIDDLPPGQHPEGVGHGMTGLYSAEPCGTSDPAPGVRLLVPGDPVRRLSAREALHLAGELITASLDSLAAPPLVMPPDEFALSRAVWALLEDSGHGDCGGWSRKPGGDVLCACGAVIALPLGAEKLERA